MAFYSYQSSDGLTEPVWSAVASAQPSIFDSTVLSYALFNENDLRKTIELYSLPRVDVHKDTYFEYQPIFIGAGASYQVYMQKFKQWEKPVAIKYIKSTASRGNEDGAPSSVRQRFTVLREIHALCLLSGHRNVTNILAWGEHNLGELTTFLIAEYAPHGSLDSFLRENKPHLDVENLFKICTDIAEGIYAMHSRNIVHGDVKAANILVFEEAPNQFGAKLSDLAFSLILDLDDGEACYWGTNIYNAPELRGEGSRRLKDLNPMACDVYSYGLLVWTVFKYGEFFLKGASTSLVGGNSEEQLLDSVSALQVLDHAVEFARTRDTKNESEVLGNILHACLQVDPAARLSISDILRFLNPSAQHLPATTNLNFSNKLTKRQFAQLGNLDISQAQALHYAPKFKQQLVQKLLKAAKNPKNPRGADLAFEVSKCFAAGFGVTEDIPTMKYWLNIAAERGHAFAKAMMKTFELQKLQNKELESHPIMNLDIEILALEMNRQALNAEFNNASMDHVLNFPIYSCSDAAVIESLIQQSMSTGLDIASVIGDTEQSLRTAPLRARFSLLHWAARVGRVELIEILLKFGANINSIDPVLHRTPLLFALDASQIAVSELLLSKGADPNKPDRYGRTASHYLFKVPPDKVSMMTDLLKRHSLDTSVEVSHPYQTPCNEQPLAIDCSSLYSEACCGNLRAVSVLLEEFGRDMTAEHYSTAIWHAVVNMHATTCDKILHMALRSFDTLPNLSPFIYLAGGAIYNLMLYHGESWPEALNSTIEVLLSYGFDINGHDGGGLTALGFAVILAEPVIASTLHAHGASLELKTTNGLILLDYAIYGVSNSQNLGCVPWLLDCAAPLAPSEPEGTSGRKSSWSALHIASAYNAYGAAKVILERTNVDINGQSSDGDTPLHVACSRNALEMVEFLVNNGANTTKVNNLNHSSLEAAVHGISIEVVEFFLSRDVGTYNPHSIPPRCILAFFAGLREQGGSRLLQLLLDYTITRSPDALQRKDSISLPILATAVVARNDDLLLDLLHTGAEIRHPHEQRSEWKMLVEDHSRKDYYSTGDSRQIQKYVKVLEAFVDRFTQQTWLHAVDEEGKTILYHAALCTNVSAVTVLLATGLSVHDIDYYGTSLIHDTLIGAFNSNPAGLRRPIEWLGRQELVKTQAVMAILRLLLEAGADPNAVEAGSFAPAALHIAVMAAWALRDTSPVELLCEHGANADAPALNMYGVRPLHIALEAPTFIRAWGIDFSWSSSLVHSDEANSQEAQEMETLKALIRVLRNAGVKFNSLRGLGSCEVAEATAKCSSIGLRAMLEEGVKLTRALETGQEACHYAAQWVEMVGKRKDEVGDARLIQSSRTWLNARLSKADENLEIVREYLDRRKSAKVEGT